MFITILDFLVFILLVGCILAAYVYLRGLSREKLTQQFILHNAYSMNPTGGLTYEGMAVVVEEDGSRSPRAEDISQDNLEEMIRWNYHAAERLSWAWPITLPLTSYRIRKALELAQIRQDIEQEVYGENDAGAHQDTTPYAPITSEADDEEAPEEELETAPPTAVMDRIPHDTHQVTEVLDTDTLEDNLPASNGNGVRHSFLNGTQRSYIMIPRPTTVSSPNDAVPAEEHNAKIQHLAEDILTTLDTTQQDVVQHTEDDMTAQERVEQRSHEVQQQLEVERERGFLK